MHYMPALSFYEPFCCVLCVALRPLRLCGVAFAELVYRRAAEDAE